MAIDSFKVRANALRAEAKSARADVSETYQSRMSGIETEAARVRRDTKIAEQSAQQATEDAKGFEASRGADYTTAFELDQSAAAAKKRGDTKQAEEDTEAAAHFRGSAKRHEQQEREATLEAAKYREEAAGHDVRAKELQYEVRDTNGLNNAAEKNLDNLEKRARLYEEANRKFDEADGVNGSVSAPMRRRLQNEAQAALDKADAIEVDRAAIRALAPDFPEQTPGFDAAVSSVTPNDDDADPTALAFAADANADADAVAVADVDADLGIDQEFQAGADDELSPAVDSSAAVASSNEGSAADTTADVEQFTFDTPEPALADAEAQDATFGATDAFEDQDFASAEEPAESFADSAPSFADDEFA